MPHEDVDGGRLYYEELGEGQPILCIHGTGSAGYVWSEAAEKLGELGRAIVYDRRGFTRSPRPEPVDVTTVREHTDDAYELLRALDASPAVVVGRSYGGGVALDLALRYPDAVSALVLLEAVPVGLSPEADAWLASFTETIERAATERGVHVVGETLLREALGEWDGLPADLRELFTANSQAILAETRGGELAVDGARLRTISAPTLLVSAEDSPAAFRAVTDALAEEIPGARAERVGGGHLIDPADPVVLEFVSEVLSREQDRA